MHKELGSLDVLWDAGYGDHFMHQLLLWGCSIGEGLKQLCWVFRYVFGVYFMCLYKKGICVSTLTAACSVRLGFRNRSRLFYSYPRYNTPNTRLSPAYRVYSMDSQIHSEFSIAGRSYPYLITVLRECHLLRRIPYRDHGKSLP